MIVISPSRYTVSLHVRSDQDIVSQDNWEWHQIQVAKDAPHPSARDFACIVALDGGRLLVHGGLDAAERRLDDAWVFDTVT